MDSERSRTARRHAGVEEIVHALLGPRVLTRAALEERVGAGAWKTVSFSAALHAAIAEGRVRQLSDDLFEIAEGEKLFSPD